MEIQLKQRVIGAVVFVAIAVIFLPLLFKDANNNSGTKQVIITEQIPTPPPAPGPQQTIANPPDTAPSSPQTLNNQNTSAAPTSQTNSSLTSQTDASQQNIASDDTPVASNTSQQPTIAANSKLSQIATNNSTNPEITKAVTNTQASANANNNVGPQLASNDIQSVGDDDNSDAVSSKPPKLNKQNAIASAQSSMLDEETPASGPVVKTKNKKVTTKNNTHVDKIAVNDGKNSSISKIARISPTPIKGSAWVVQLGAFSNKSNAKLLQQQLQGHGFNAYTQKVKTSRGQLVKVLVGPETQRQKAVAVQTKLNKSFNLKGVLVAYDPHEAGH